MFNTQLKAQDVKTAAKNVFYGKGQIFSFEISALPTASQYFIIEVMKPTATNKDGKKLIAPYFKLDAAGDEPAVPGATIVSVDLVGGDTKVEALAKLKAVLEADLDIRFVEIVGDKITFQSKFHGLTAAIADGSTATGFTFKTELEGFGGFLGATQDGVEFTPEPEIEDIPADQVGGAPLTSIIKSLKLSLKTKIIELSKERFNMLYGRVIGSVFTPDAGTEVMGFGTEKVGQSMANLAGELILLPLNFDNAAPVYDDVFFFFECSAIPGGLVWSNDIQSLEVNFTPYIDSTKVKKAAYGLRGNGFQKGIRA